MRLRIWSHIFVFETTIIAIPMLEAAFAIASRGNYNVPCTFSLNWISMCHRRAHMLFRCGRHHLNLLPSVGITCTHDWFGLLRVSGRGSCLYDCPPIVCLSCGLFTLQHSERFCCCWWTKNHGISSFRFTFAGRLSVVLTEDRNRTRMLDIKIIR